MNRTFRYMTWTIEQDPSTYPEYSATCVTREDSNCGETIHACGPDWAEEWMRRHTQDTGHTRYRRTSADYVTLAPPGDTGLIIPGEVAQPRALPAGDDAT
ncbi:hypothetical protein AB0I22_10640 [Streptomyces sp. NPDC050610]|uniref:DUF7848 domain-containing protein n=1 Tax=Streptomyces sp. NPDC050610 TaxID=3157097 RepID=UPI0034452C07